MKNIIIVFFSFFFLSFNNVFSQKKLNPSNNKHIIQSSLIKCDTLTISDIYKKINHSQSLIIESITPKLVKRDSIIFKKSRITTSTFQFSDSFNVTYTLNEKYDAFEIKNDREYLLVNNEKILIDSLYFKKTLEDYTFRAADGIIAYQAYLKSSQYLFLFAKNSSGMFSGTCLFIFCKNTTDSLGKLVYYGEQLSEDMNCFGVNKNETELFFYEWTMANGNYNTYYNVYQIKNDRIEKTEKKELNIKETSSYQLLYCE